jgi:hypothetical protein
MNLYFVPIGTVHLPQARVAEHSAALNLSPSMKIERGLVLLSLQEPISGGKE